MESPVVLDKPPEYHGKGDERGFPFDEEESSGAWSSLAARHPDIAARLRQRPATWARKRRPSSQDAGDDFGDRFGEFDRFPFDDIPPEFRDHFPAHWGRRFEEPPPQHTPPPPQPQQQQAPASPQSHHTTAATQTEVPSGSQDSPFLPQYGLRNTVDLGQKSATDPSVDADERSQRSMSAPPAARPATMSGHHEPPPPDHHSTVRHIPIFVEGRDEPVINKSEPEPKPHYAPPPHVDRDQYFADEGPATFHHPPNFSRAFGTPFNKGFRQGPQPFTQQKAYPQTAFTRGASPQRSQSPKPPPQPEEQHAKHEPAPRAQPPPPPPAHQPPHQPPPPPQQPHAASPPPPKPQPSPKDPITLILSIQTDVLNLMSEVENFVGTKKDKKYIYLDEMLTRNLIKLDNIETEGKDNIRQARREAIKCIEKCIAVLEAKADGRTTAAAPPADPAPQHNQPADQQTENSEPEMQNTKEEAQPDTQEMKDVAQENDQQKTEENVKVEAKPEEIKQDSKPQTEQESKPQAEQESKPQAEQDSKPLAADTRPENRAVLVEKPEDKSEEADKKGSPKKSTKVVKKRDKSKDKNKDSPKEEAEEKKVESMQVDDKGDKTGPQQMEVDGAAASQ